MMIAPLIFGVLVQGIASMTDMKKLGRVGLKTLAYFTVVLAITLIVVPEIPVASLALLLGVDKPMSECHALTNVIGNGVATIAVSRWEGEVSGENLRRALRGDENGASL